MNIKIAKPKSVYHQVVDSIGANIIRGAFKEGEQLPVEHDLSAQYGVSRPIIREATKILASKGLLNSKPKIGTVVTQKDKWNWLDDDIILWMTETRDYGQFLDMLFEARLGIEPMASELAANKATAQDLKAIKQAFSEMQAAETLEDSYQPDLQFHLAILKATHNQVIYYIGRSLQKALIFSFSLTTWNRDTYEIALVRHKAILNAIADGDAASASSATRELLLESRQDYDRRLNAGKN